MVGPELVSLEEIRAKMDPVEAERLRTVRNIGIAVRVSVACDLDGLLNIYLPGPHRFRQDHLHGASSFLHRPYQVDS